MRAIRYGHSTDGAVGTPEWWDTGPRIPPDGGSGPAGPWHLIDTVQPPGIVLSFDPASGYSGRLAGKRAIVVYTGGVYFDGAPPAFGVDFHRCRSSTTGCDGPASDVTELRFQPDLVTDDADGARDAALAAAREAGQRLHQRALV